MTDMIEITLKELRDANGNRLSSFECVLSLGGQDLQVTDNSQSCVCQYIPGSFLSMSVSVSGQSFFQREIPMDEMLGKPSSVHSLSLQSEDESSLAVLLEIAKVQESTQGDSPDSREFSRSKKSNTILPKKLQDDHFKALFEAEREKNVVLQSQLEEADSIVRQKDLRISELSASLAEARTGEESARKDFTPKISRSSVSYEQAIIDFQEKTQQQQETIESLKQEKKSLILDITAVKSSLHDSESKLEKLRLDFSALESSSSLLKSQFADHQQKSKHSLRTLQTDLEFANDRVETLSSDKDILQACLNKERSEFQSSKDLAKSKATELENTINSQLATIRDLQDSLDTSAAELTRLKAENSLCNAKHEEITSQLKDFYEEYGERLQSEIARKDAQIEKEAQEHRQEFAALQTARTELACQVTSLEIKVKEHEDVISQLENSISNYKQTLEERDETIIKQNHDIADHEQDKLILQDELDLAKLNFKSIKMRNKTQIKANQEQAGIIASLQQELQENVEKVDALQRTLNQYYAKAKYVPVKVDPVDMAMAQYVNNREEPLNVPFVREEPGIYRFGFRKVFVKIENGVLAIRVGGGYMLIDEFIDLYTPIEMEKILHKNNLVNRAIYNIAHDNFSPLMSRCKSSDIPDEVQHKRMKEQLEQGKFTAMYTPKAIRSRYQALKRSSTFTSKEYEILLNHLK